MNRLTGLIRKSWPTEAPIGPHSRKSTILHPQVHTPKCMPVHPTSRGQCCLQSKKNDWTQEFHQWNSICSRTAQSRRKKSMFLVQSSPRRSKVHCQSLPPCRAALNRVRVWRLYNSAPWNQSPGAQFTCLPLGNIWASPGVMDEKYAFILCVKE